MRNTRSPQRPKSGPPVGLSSPIGWYKQCKTTGEWFDHQIGCEPLTCITRQPSVKPWKILMIMSCSFTIRPLWWYTTDLTTLWRYTSSRSMRGERIRSVRCKILNWCSEQHIRRRRGKHAALSATHRVYEATVIKRVYEATVFVRARRCWSWRAHGLGSERKATRCAIATDSELLAHGLLARQLPGCLAPQVDPRRDRNVAHSGCFPLAAQPPAHSAESKQAPFPGRS